MTLPAIEVQNLGKSFLLNRGRGEAEKKTVWVLNDISFKADPGDVIGIIGKNGAGKSTLLKILARITEPTRGKAIIRGRVASLLEVGTGFHEELSGRENVFMNGTLLGMMPSEVRKRFDEIVAFSGVERYIDQPVKHYSSGMRVRLAFSVAAHLDPEVMFIDEVLSVGDMEFQDRCLKRMNQLTTEFGRTVLFVSHNMNAVASLCPRALLLNQGNCEALGPTGEIIKKYHALVHGKKEKAALAERQDRTGAGGVRFLEVEMQDAAGRKIEFARSGTHLRLALRYRFDPDTRMGERITVNVAFNNARGQRLFAIPSDLIGRTEGNVPREGWCYADIPRLALMPGRYEIDLAYQVDRLTVDKVTGAAVVPVVEGPFYPSGRLPNSLSGDLLVDYDWSFAERARPAAAPALEEAAPEEADKPVKSQLVALAQTVNGLEATAKAFLKQPAPLDLQEHERLAQAAAGLADRLARLQRQIASDDEVAVRLAPQIEAALDRTRHHVADAELSALLGVAVPERLVERGIAVDDPRLPAGNTVVATIAEYGRPAHGLGAFVQHAVQNWQGSAQQRQAMELVAQRARGFLARCDALLEQVPGDLAALDVHEQVTARLDEVAHQAEFAAAADADAGAEDLLRAWRRLRATQALRAPDEVKDPVEKPVRTRLSALAQAINAVERVTEELPRQPNPVEPERHRRLSAWIDGFATRVAGLRELAPADDQVAGKVAGQLEGALERARRNLGDVEIAMLLGIPVPEEAHGRDFAVDDPRINARDTVAASLAEFGRPVAALDAYVDHARRSWRGSEAQRRAMAIVARRAGGFLRRSDELLERAPADPEALDVHGQVTRRLKDLSDWAGYLAEAPADAGTSAEELFAAWQAASAVRELHLSQIFPGIEAISVPIGAINQESAHENQVDLLYVSAIAKAIGARRLFEIGTYMGRTTWHLARVAPDAEVWTLNLPPEADPRIAPVLGSYYRGTPEEARIHELWTDSRTFDPGELAGTMDFVFVDADHCYEAVVADTERALRLVRPGGVVIWHDYAAKSPGVVRFAHDFARTRPLFRIRHTCLLCMIEGVDATSFEPAAMRRGLGD
ncbi:ATP-binding cassette domain-containing protein [Geminicoccus roseus]|uniref:ATP-binding cassette domain-containing protein n=1 Tax=Geminicoccus roseus TaxID=404900 RepID=UPI00041F53AC|nr:ATP-binding cassette domain-containing protein [Geminicoccus roseus]